MEQTGSQREYSLHLRGYFFNITKTKALIRRLKGKKVLIFGNHDAELQADPELPAVFTEWGMMLERVIDGRHICRTHYPMPDWRATAKAAG